VELGEALSPSRVLGTRFKLKLLNLKGSATKKKELETHGRRQKGMVCKK
jgi:hypothetical protein